MNIDDIYKATDTRTLQTENTLMYTAYSHNVCTERMSARSVHTHTHTRAYCVQTQTLFHINFLNGFFTPHVAATANSRGDLLPSTHVCLPNFSTDYCSCLAHLAQPPSTLFLTASLHLIQVVKDTYL